MNHTALLFAAAVAASAAAQPAPPDYGFNFITIGDVGNPAYTGPSDEHGVVANRGAVDYEYRIARTEVTTAQYVEYLNARTAAGVPVSFGDAPRYIGAEFDFGSNRWFPQAGQEMYPVVGVSWREAAKFTNWLHNDKAVTADAFMSGAYDVSTFGRIGMTYTDQTSRSEGAQYWIPSMDEWMKASHYDPHRYGPNQGGWWQYNDSSDTQPVPGLPGVGETSAGVDLTDAEAYAIPLESYPETQTPWGLLDTSGGAAEWTEEWARINSPDEQEYRIWQGNAAGLETWEPNDPFGYNTDLINQFGSDRPDFVFPRFTLRVASAVPASGSGIVVIGCGLLMRLSRRR